MRVKNTQIYSLEEDNPLDSDPYAGTPKRWKSALCRSNSRPAMNFPCATQAKLHLNL
jgi:hypothetical protein